MIAAICIFTVTIVLNFALNTVIELPCWLSVIFSLTSFFAMIVADICYENLKNRVGKIEKKLKESEGADDENNHL